MQLGISVYMYVYGAVLCSCGLFAFAGAINMNCFRDAIRMI